MSNTATRMTLEGTDGVRLAADRRGDPDQPVVVLLHGAGQTRHAWLRTTERLSTHHRGGGIFDDERLSVRAVATVAKHLRSIGCVWADADRSETVVAAVAVVALDDCQFVSLLSYTLEISTASMRETSKVHRYGGCSLLLRETQMRPKHWCEPRV